MPAATNPTRSTPVISATSGGGAATAANNGSPQGESVPGGEERCPVGSTVRCTVQSAETVTYEGEVLAYDPKKVLVLKCLSSSGRSSLFNVHMVNLALPCEWKVISERKDAIADPPWLNLKRLENRKTDQVERKKKQIMSFKAGVSPVGHMVFQTITKTIDDISWSGENIVVLKEVTIYPPYKPEDVRGNMESKALKHVRKIVEKFFEDQQQSPAAPASASVASSSSTSTAAQSRTSPTEASPQRSAEGSSSKQAAPPTGRAPTGKTPQQARSSAAGGNATGSARSGSSREPASDGHHSHHSPHGTQQHYHTSPKQPFNQ